MKEIALTQNKVALVDDSDYESLSAFKWQAKFDGHNWYAKRGVYNKETKTCGCITMHQQLMNPPLGMKVDHRDHDGLNCQRSNMRLCTHGQNMMNKRPKKNGTSKYLGVMLKRDRVKGKDYFSWSAQIRIEGKNYHIGRFKTEENAATAYNIFAEKHHGEFANFNKPII